MTIPRLVFPPNYDPSVCVLVAIPMSFVPIVGGALEQLEWRASWETVADWQDGRAVIIDIEECLIMGDCTSGIVAAIENAARTADFCCILGQGVPFFEEAPSPFQRGEGDPPEPYETWSEFTDYMCKAAQMYADRLIQSLQGTVQSVESGASVSVGILASLCGLLNPVAGLLVVAVGLLGNLALQEALGDLLDEVEAGKYDLVCSIFTSANASLAMSNIADWIDALDVPSVAKSFLATLITQDGINAVFAGDYETDGYQESYCEACENIPGWYCVYGTPKGLLTGPTEITTELDYPYYFLAVQYNAFGACQNADFEAEVTEGVVGGFNSGSVDQCDTTRLWDYNDLPTQPNFPPLDGNAWSYYPVGNTPFKVLFDPLT
jgi:hypothetical protein